MLDEKGRVEFSEPFWTRMRRELVDWFTDRAPSLVDGYVGAVQLLHMPGFPGRVHFICHAVRDLYTETPVAIGHGRASLPREVFPQLHRNLAEDWRREPPRRIEPRLGEPAEYRIGERLFVRAACVVNQVEAFGREPKLGERLAAALFESVSRASNEYMPNALAQSLKEEYDYFVRVAHLPAKARLLPSDAELVERFESFERGFHALVGPYFSGKEELDAILDETNRQAD